MGRRAAAGASLAALVLAGLASAFILTRSTPFALGGDNETLLHPLLTDAFRQVRSGQLPIWTTGRWGGSPLIGDPVVGALYPPYYLGYALTASPHRRALDVALCLHLALLMSGTAWLLGTLGASPMVACATAVLMAANPTVVFIGRSWAQDWAALAYWPWLLAAAARLGTAPAVPAVLVAAAALAAQVYAGYPQFALYSGLAALLWIACQPGTPLRGRVGVAILIAGGAIGLAAPQILPGLAMAEGSIRRGPGAEANLAALRAFAIPVGAWSDVVRAAPMAVLLPCKVAPVVVVLAAVGAAGRWFAPRFLAVVAAACAVLASGPEPLERVLEAVPPFSFFGAPVKFFYLAVFLCIVLAGLGLERLRTAPRVSAALALLLLTLVTLPAFHATVVRAGWLLVAGGLALLGVARGRLRQDALVVIVVLASVAFLRCTGALVMPNAWVAAPYRALLQDLPREAVPRQGGRAVLLASDGVLRQVGLNYGALWGVETLNGVGPLAQWRQQEATERAERGHADAVVRQWGADPVLVAPGAGLETSLVQAGYGPLGAMGGLHVLSAGDRPAPRYQLAPVVRFVPAAEAIAAAREGRALDETSVVVEGASDEPAPVGDERGRLEILEGGPALARLRVALDRPTWLVAREPYYANWEAAVDGRPVGIRPAGGFFLALPVSAGEHEIVLAYREPGLARGALIAAVTMVLLPLLARLAVDRLRPNGRGGGS